MLRRLASKRFSVDRLEFKAYRRMIYDLYCNQPEIHFMRGVRLVHGVDPADFILRHYSWSFFAVHRPKRSCPFEAINWLPQASRVMFNILRYNYPRL
jgi:hypothetical protein